MIRELRVVLKFYYLFFTRQVLGMSIMKNNFVKVYLSVMGVILYFVLLISVYKFISFEGFKYEHVEYLLNTYTINIILTTYLLFIIIKFFFISNTDVEEKLKIFPISNRMIRLSSLLLESIIYLVFIISFSALILIPILLRYKLEIFPTILSNVIFTSFSVYLILHLSYNLFLMLFNSDTKRRLFPLLFVLLSILSMIILVDYSNDLVMSISVDFLENNSAQYGFLLWKNIAEKTNFLVSFVVFIAFSIFCSYMITLTTSTKTLVNYKYLNLKMMKHNYIACLIKSNVRKLSSIVNVIIYYLLFFTFTIVDYSILALPALVSIASLYVFSNTFSIRKYQYSINNSSVKEYLSLLSSQTIYGLIALLPTLIYMRSFIIAFQIIIVYMVSMIIMLLLGILFPSKEENPLTPLISFVVFFIIIMFLILFASILQLSTMQIYIAISLTICFVVALSCYGIGRIMKGERK